MRIHKPEWFINYYHRIIHSFLLQFSPYHSFVVSSSSSACSQIGRLHNYLLVLLLQKSVFTQLRCYSWILWYSLSWLAKLSGQFIAWLRKQILFFNCEGRTYGTCNNIHIVWELNWWTADKNPCNQILFLPAIEVLGMKVRNAITLKASKHDWDQ